MFFFLSKTLNIFTMPLLIVVGLLLFALFSRSQRWRTRTLRAGVILLIFCCNEFVANEVMTLWELPATPFSAVEKKYEWGILLCGVTKSGIEPKDRVYFSRGADRVIHTFQLYQKGMIKKVMISGGSGSIVDRGHREASEIASVLILFGVKPEDILIDNKSNNTHDSAIEVPALLGGKATPEQCLLITSAFHMRRSLACFTKAGWHMDTFSTDFLTHERRYSVDVLLVPSLDALVAWHVLAKEWVGFVAYKIAGYI